MSKSITQTKIESNSETAAISALFWPVVSEPTVPLSSSPYMTIPVQNGVAMENQFIQHQINWVIESALAYQGTDKKLWGLINGMKIEEGEIESAKKTLFTDRF